MDDNREVTFVHNFDKADLTYAILRHLVKLGSLPKDHYDSYEYDHKKEDNDTLRVYCTLTPRNNEKAPVVHSEILISVQEVFKAVTEHFEYRNWIPDTYKFFAKNFVGLGGDSPTLTFVLTPKKTPPPPVDDNKPNVSELWKQQQALRALFPNYG